MVCSGMAVREPRIMSLIYTGNGFIIDSIPSGSVQTREANMKYFIGGGKPSWDSNLLSLQSWNQPIPRDSASCPFHVHSRMNTMRSWKHMQAWMITLQAWKSCSHTRTCWMMRFSLNGWNHAGIITTCRIPHWFQCLQRTWFIMARLNMKHGNSYSIP